MVFFSLGDGMDLRICKFTASLTTGHAISLNIVKLLIVNITLLSFSHLIFEMEIYTHVDV